MTATEAADCIGISNRTLSRWHLQRVGPPRIKIGGRVLYRRCALLEWLKGNEQAPVRSFADGTAGV
ncbi:helix-turn-helix transcriptional regulator [Roseovarius sp.]|uniref:helix-turn-helix transcriptional regulator n=1 Tax=Roseovarius sp. TaxID=1486281 RepID=UPI003B598121